jgi:hypothetical protein
VLNETGIKCWLRNMLSVRGLMGWNYVADDPPQFNSLAKILSTPCHFLFDTSQAFQWLMDAIQASLQFNEPVPVSLF